MAEIKLKSKHLNSLKKVVKDAEAERLTVVEVRLKCTQERLKYFEKKYQMQTAEFLNYPLYYIHERLMTINIQK